MKSEKNGIVETIILYDPEGRIIGVFDDMRMSTKDFWDGLFADSTIEDEYTSEWWLSGNDNIIGTPLSDGISGDNGDDLIFAGGGDDHVNGGYGDDVVQGGFGHDTIRGHYGDDELTGSSGNDLLIGGYGRDVLRGGSGADQFVYEGSGDSNIFGKSDVRDRILDFNRAQGDKINLKAYDAKQATFVDDAFKFIGTQAFHKKAGELRFEKKNGDTFISGDTDGDGKTDLQIIVDASITFKASDFIL